MSIEPIPVIVPVTTDEFRSDPETKLFAASLLEAVEKMKDSLVVLGASSVDPNVRALAVGIVTYRHLHRELTRKGKTDE